MSYQIRTATADDGEALLELWHGFTDHLSEFDRRYHHNESADDRWLQYFENQLLGSKYGTVLVAEPEGSAAIVGALEARIMGNHPIFRLKNHGYINGHFVETDHRGNGLGERLLDAAHEWFSESDKDVDFYRVDTIHGDSHAMKFYEDLGFQPVEHVYERPTDQGQ